MVWPFNLKTDFTQLEEFAGKEFMHKKTNVADQEKNKPHNRDPNFGKPETWEWPNSNSVPSTIFFSALVVAKMV